MATKSKKQQAREADTHLHIVKPSVVGDVKDPVERIGTPTMKKGVKEQRTTVITKTHEVFARLPMADAIATLKDGANVERSMSQACLSIMANYWLDHALPAGASKREVRTACNKAMTKALEPMIWGEKHTEVYKPAIWANAKSKVSGALAESGSHESLFAETKDGDMDRESILSIGALMKLTSAKRTDVEKAASAFEYLTDEETPIEAITANKDQALVLVQEIANIVGTSAVLKALDQTRQEQAPEDVIRELLFNDHAPLIRSMLEAFELAAADKASKAA